jgi:hypothetical protein
MSQSTEIQSWLEPEYDLEVLVPEKKNWRDAWRPGAREEVFNKGGEAVVDAKQYAQVQQTHLPASLHRPKVSLSVFRLYTWSYCFLPRMVETRFGGGTSVYMLCTVVILVFCVSGMS